MNLFEDFLEKPIKELVTDDKAYIRLENNPTLYACTVKKTGHKKIVVEYLSQSNKNIKLEFNKNDGSCVDRKRDYGKYKLLSENQRRNVIYEAQQELKKIKSNKELLETSIRSLNKMFDDNLDSKTDDLNTKLKELREVNESLKNFLS